MFCYPLARFVWGKPEPVPESVRLAGLAKMALGDGQLFKYGSKPGLLLHTNEGEWRAFSAICTHLECTVRYERAKSRIFCACHEGVYDLAGKNVSGPPPKPLNKYVVEVDGDDLVVSLPKDS
jgi:Rieske Fe-S protein